ncbi:MAG: winged helix-turn-helix transcriptional regulator [Promethearchaeota archaeon]
MIASESNNLYAEDNSILEDKRCLLILEYLFKNGSKSFTELKNSNDDLKNDKTLTKKLNLLIKKNLIIKENIQRKPYKSGYKLSEKGYRLISNKDDILHYNNFILIEKRSADFYNYITLEFHGIYTKMKLFQDFVIDCMSYLDYLNKFLIKIEDKKAFDTILYLVLNHPDNKYKKLKEIILPKLNKDEIINMINDLKEQKQIEIFLIRDKTKLKYFLLEVDPILAEFKETVNLIFKTKFIHIWNFQDISLANNFDWLLQFSYHILNLKYIKQKNISKDDAYYRKFIIPFIIYIREYIINTYLMDKSILKSLPINLIPFSNQKTFWREYIRNLTSISKIYHNKFQHFLESLLKNGGEYNYIEELISILYNKIQNFNPPKEDISLILIKILNLFYLQIILRTFYKVAPKKYNEFKKEKNFEIRYSNISNISYQQVLNYNKIINAKSSVNYTHLRLIIYILSERYEHLKMLVNNSNFTISKKGQSLLKNFFSNFLKFPNRIKSILYPIILKDFIDNYKINLCKYIDFENFYQLINDFMKNQKHNNVFLLLKLIYRIETDPHRNKIIEIIKKIKLNMHQNNTTDFIENFISLIKWFLKIMNNNKYKKQIMKELIVSIAFIYQLFIEETKNDKRIYSLFCEFEDLMKNKLISIIISSNIDNLVDCNDTQVNMIIIKNNYPSDPISPLFLKKYTKEINNYWQKFIKVPTNLNLFQLKSNRFFIFFNKLLAIPNKEDIKNYLIYMNENIKENFNKTNLTPEKNYSNHNSESNQIIYFYQNLAQLVNIKPESLFNEKDNQNYDLFNAFPCYFSKDKFANISTIPYEGSKDSNNKSSPIVSFLYYDLSLFMAPNLVNLNKLKEIYSIINKLHGSKCFLRYLEIVLSYYEWYYECTLTTLYQLSFNESLNLLTFIGNLIKSYFYYEEREKSQSSNYFNKASKQLKKLPMDKLKEKNELEWVFIMWERLNAIHNE